MRLLFLLMLSCLFLDGYAGVFDTIRDIPVSRYRTDITERIFNDEVWDLDSSNFICEVRELQNIAAESEDRELEAFALYSMARYYRFNIPDGIFKSPEIFRKALEISEKHNIGKYTGEITHSLGENIFRSGDYKEGFKYMLRGDQLMKEYGYEKFYHVSRHLYHLAYSYFSFGNYERAVHYLELSLKYSKSYPKLRVGSYNLLGMMYNRLKNPDTALYFFNKALNDKYSYTIPRGMLLGNIGDLYLKQGELKKARSFLERSYNAYWQEGKFSSHSLAPLITLADLELTEKQLKEAKKRLDEFYFLAREHHQEGMEIWAEYYKLSTTYYTETEDYKAAKLYQDSLVSLQNNINAKMDANMLANLEIQIITQEHLADIALMKKEKSRQKVIFNATWIISCLAIIILLGVFHIVRLRQRRKQDELESERERVQEQVENYRSRLEFFIEGIRKKNELIEKLKEQLDDTSLYDTENYTPTYPENKKIIEQLYESVILTKEDWLNFKRLFEKSHPGFILKLRMEYPNLTVAEVRFLMLVKLNLSPPEMANMLGISSESVSRTSQRLRKKLGLSDPLDLIKLVNSIDD